MQTPDAAARVAAEVRAELGRRSISFAGLARKLGVSVSWVRRRIGGPTPAISPTLADLEQIAGALGVDLRTWFPSGVEPGAEFGYQADEPKGVTR